MRGGIADSDRVPDNFLRRIDTLEKELEKLKRWTTPIGSVLLPNPPSIKAWRTTALGTTTGVYSVVTALTNSLDEDGLELEDGSSIIKLRRDSSIEEYVIGVAANWAANAVNNRVVQLQVRNINTGAWVGQDWDSRPAAVNGLNTLQPVPIVYRMGATDDAIRFRVYQDSGGNLNLNFFLVNIFLSKSGDVPAP